MHIKKEHDTFCASDVKSFAPAREIDPRYADLLQQAEEEGVFISPVPSVLSKTEVKLKSELLDYYL